MQQGFKDKRVTGSTSFLTMVFLQIQLKYKKWQRIPPKL